MPVDGLPLQQGAVVLTVAVTLVFGWYLSEWDQVRAHLTARFLYGVPWGTVVTVIGVVAFYLFAQSGLSHWSDPVTVAFRNWAYRYTMGMFTSGFAHGSPGHLLSNMIATVVLAPIAEYAWGHYPPRTADEADTDRSSSMSAGDRRPEQTARQQSGSDSGGRPVPDSRDGERVGPREDGDTARKQGDGRRRPDGGRPLPSSEASEDLLSRPWVRALVVFPGVVVGVSLLTSLYALGWSLGFSGTVFAFLGFILVRYPLTTVVSMVGLTALNVVVATLREPVLRATTEAGSPGPPAWAGVNVQAHLLGFLIGVVLGIVLLWSRDERPSAPRLLFATLLVVLARQLWALALGSDGVYYQYRAFGVVFVLFLSMVVTVTVAVDDEHLSELASRGLTVLAVGWLVLLAVGSVGGIVLTRGDPSVFFPILAVTPLLAAPALALVVPGTLSDSSLSHRHLLVAAVLVITAVVALPSLVGNAPGMDSDAIPEDAVRIGDYHVAYDVNVSHGRINSSDSGLIVASERRYVWTVAVTEQQLAHRGNVTVPVGGLGWRETVDAQRRGWDVVGNDSVYIVDVTDGDEQNRSFVSSNSTADLLVGNRTVSLGATKEGFYIEVHRSGSVLGTAPVPAVNESSTVASLEFVATPRDDTTAIFVETDDTRVLLAEKESF